MGIVCGMMCHKMPLNRAIQYEMFSAELTEGGKLWLT
jgi:hypothetical protein